MKTRQTEIEFFDFDDFERLVDGARKVDPAVLAFVLLDGEAGLRRGEIIALDLTDADFRRGQLTMARRRRSTRRSGCSSSAVRPWATAGQRRLTRNRTEVGLAGEVVSPPLRSAAAPSPATLGRVDPQALELSKQPLSVLRSDNPFVLGQAGFDEAVTGEAEDTFALLFNALLDGRDPNGLPGVAVRRPLGLSAFGPQPAANFPLTAYPSPHLEDLVPAWQQRILGFGDARQLFWRP